MVVVSQPAALDHFSLIEACKSPTKRSSEIPVIDLTAPEAKTQIVKACEDYGFFKVINHGVPMELMSKLEEETIKYFELPQIEKEKAGPPDPFGYGSKRIGPNGDVGWIEYLLLNTNPQITSLKTRSLISQTPPHFWSAVNEYILAVKKIAYQVLEMVAEGLKIEPRNVFSRLLKDEKSDSCFRLNHYPLCPTPDDHVDDIDEIQAQAQAQGLNWDLNDGTKTNLIGFGEHTDPQIISVLRSNDTGGFQICLKDASWVSVPPDHTSFFLNVGDALQVMTNGRFKSVKHRVLADTTKSRISMIYFGGPALSEKIAPLPSLMENEEDSRYNEFTWSEYKKSAYKSRLADYRLGFFEKTSSK